MDYRYSGIHYCKTAKYRLIIISYLFLLYNPAQANGGKYLLGFEFGPSFGTALRMPKDSLRISGSDAGLLTLTFGCMGGYQIKNLSFGLKINYDNNEIEDSVGIDKYITHFLLYGAFALPDMHNMNLSSIFGYQAFIFRAASIQDTASHYRKSGYAPFLGIELNIGFAKKKNPVEETGNNTKAYNIICSGSYLYSPGAINMHLIKISVDLGLRERSGAVISLNYREHENVYRIIYATFGMYFLLNLH